MNARMTQPPLIQVPRGAQPSSTLRRFLRALLVLALAIVWAVSGAAQVPQPAETRSAELRLPIREGEELKPTPSPPGLPQCPIWENTAGEPDGFVAGNAEIASPSQTLKNALAGVSFVDFDSALPNKGFAHTFQLPRCGCIVGAKLEFAVKALGSDSQNSSGNDAITLGVSNLSGFPHWSAYFGTGQTPPGPTLTNGPWGSSTTPKTFLLDLAALPTLSGQTVSLLSAIQMHRVLDFYVQDDTSIDSIKLTYTLCNCSPCGNAELCVTKFNDKDRNGAKSANEPGLTGWSFTAKDSSGNVILFPPTNTAGKTCLAVPAPATYTFSEISKPGWVPTTPANPVAVVSPGGVKNLTFGNWRKGIRDGDVRDEANRPR